MSSIARCRLGSIGVLEVAGADARQFLHAQTTQDIAGLADRRATLAAWLTAKGRVRALFDVVATDGVFRLLMPRDQLEPVCRQLKMFVLRSKVEIRPLPDVVVDAVVGDTNEWLRERGLDTGNGAAPVEDRISFVNVGTGLVLVVGDVNDVESALADIARCDDDAVELAAIRLGRPEVPFALSDAYIPQMLNLDALDAVSFTKGCYPGQEIVARTANRGTVKRRLRRFRTGAGARPEPGDAIAADGETVGQVNRAADVESGYELLAVVQLDALDGKLTLAADGRGLEPVGG